MEHYKKARNACYFAYITGAVATNFAPILFVIFMNEFGLSYSGAAALTAVNFFTQLIVDGIAVHFLHKIGYRAAAVLAHVFVAAGLIIMGTAAVGGGFAVLILSVITYAIGAGLLEVIISPIVESLPSDEKSGQMSLLHSFYCWGQVITVLVTTLVLKIFGNGIWRVLCVAWAALPLLNTVNFLKAPMPESLDEENGPGVRTLIKHKFFIIALFLMMSSGASEITMSQWSSAFAEIGLGVPKFVGDLLGPCAFAVLMGTVRTLYGVFSSKIKLIPLLMGSSALCIVCYLAASLSGVKSLSLVACALTGIGVAVMWPGTLSLMCEKIPDGRTAMFGMAALAGDVGCSAGPWICGLVADATSTAGHGIFIAQPGIYSGILCGVVFPLIMVAGLFAAKRID